MTYEKSVSRIEEIIGRLSDESISLEASLKLFEEGTGLLCDCKKMLEEAEKKAEILMPEGKYEQQL